MILRREESFKIEGQDDIILKEMVDNIVKQGRKGFRTKVQCDKTMDFRKMLMDGFGAEMAFCRMAGINFDATYNKKKDYSKQPDFVLNNGLTGDVKQTVYPLGALLIRSGKEKKYVNIYVLMTGEYPFFVYKGWAKYEEIIKRENVQNKGHGNAFVLNQYQLNFSLDA